MNNNLDKDKTYSNDEIFKLTKNFRNAIDQIKNHFEQTEENQNHLKSIEDSFNLILDLAMDLSEQQIKSLEITNILETIIETSPTPTILKRINFDSDGKPNEELLLICNQAEWDLLKIPEKERAPYLAKIAKPIDMKDFRGNFGNIIEKVNHHSLVNQHYSWDDLTRDKNVNLSLDLEHKDGTRYFLKTQVRKLQDDLFIIFHQDISLEQELKEEINAFINQIIALEDKLTDSENKILQLRQNIAEGERIEKNLKSKLFYKEDILNWFEQSTRILAHDIKSPFTAILGFCSILEEPDLTDEEKTEYLNSLIKAIQNIYQVINNLLERITAGKKETIIEQNNISNIITEKVELYKPNADNKNISFLVDIPENARYAFFDLEDFKIIIQNLIDNAIKFTNADGIIKISTKQTDNSLKLIIEDNGIGMPEEKIKKLINPTKEDSSQLKKIETRGTAGEKGTGLGLKFCISMIKKNQCNLTIKSIQNEGTQFIISLPLTAKSPTNTILTSK